MKSTKSLFRSLEVDFSAKVRWRMKYDRNPVFVILQDKYKVQEYAKSKGVKTANLLYDTCSPETIPFAELPPKYLIKANHGCGWNILCYNSELYLFRDGQDLVNRDGSLLNTNSATKYKLRKAEAIQMCREWLSRKFIRREWAYQRIGSRILIEELLLPKENKELKDYRMYTFSGKVKAINVGSPSFRRNGENAFFSPDWKEFKLTKNKERPPDPLPEKPGSLGEMIDVAQRLGEDVDFARIDLYDTTQGVVLGEITIYPEGGWRDTPTSCPVFNKWLGDQWKLGRTDATVAFCWNVACIVRSLKRRIKGKVMSKSYPRDSFPDSDAICV